MRVARLKEAYPTAKVELCGAKTSIVWASSRSSARCGAPSGRGPSLRSTSGMSGPTSTPSRARKPEKLHWLILPTVSAEVFSMALEHFAREVGAGSRKRILLVLDRAGWHTAKKKLRVPEGIHLEFLPSHSPELQPSERLWPLSDEGVAKPSLRGDRGTGGGDRGALRGSGGPTRGHPLVHPLPLVAECRLRSVSIQADLVSPFPLPAWMPAITISR